jgi:uncharacterized membrane protein (UPF0182 family)
MQFNLLDYMSIFFCALKTRYKMKLSIQILCLNITNALLFNYKHIYFYLFNFIRFQFKFN